MAALNTIKLLLTSQTMPPVQPNYPKIVTMHEKLVTVSGVVNGLIFYRFVIVMINW